MLYAHHNVGRVNWATKIRDMLYNYGFQYVWSYQHVGNSDNFLSMFKQRVIDCNIQEWHSAIRTCSKLDFYAEIKSLLEPEKYLSTIINKQHRVALSRFRVSSHNLAIESGRAIAIERNDRLCKYCLNERHMSKIENELHMLVYCQLYDNLRTICNVNNYCKSENHVIGYLQSTNCDIICNTSKFIYNAMKRRENYLSKLKQ
ncbi:hypothetical protein SNE40_009669 [Patella caerulea]|uniref:Uncharacterized protein n=1 Tax=Patella caerulea TaxID=87958 RepID=A0AAN8JQ35_PATCE